MAKKVPEISLNRRRHEAFWHYVNKTDECWLWTGWCNSGGHGQFFDGYKKVVASRHSWELENGPIPEGLFICHHCDNPPCVRPEHLFLGTPKDNTHDAIAKGRLAFQRKTHCPKGHEYDHKTKRGERVCLECKKESMRKLRSIRKEISNG